MTEQEPKQEEHAPAGAESRRHTRKIVVALVLVALAAICWPFRGSIFFLRGDDVDTSNWTTHCVGRYLIDLPPSAQIDWGQPRVWGDPIIRRDDLTPESMRRLVEQRIRELKALRHEKYDVSLFIDSFELPGGGVCIHYWKAPHSTVMTIMEAYYVTPEQHVFECKAKVSNDRFDVGRDLAIQLATALRAREPWDPIPTEPGFCFKGGFVADTGAWRHEDVTIAAEFPEYPGITVAFTVTATGVPRQPLLSNISAAVQAEIVLHGAEILRRGDVVLGNGRQAQEFCFIYTEQATGVKTHYDFTLRAENQGEDQGRPEVELLMHDDAYRSSNLIPFRSNSEALGLWDAVRKNIRLRPMDGAAQAGN